MLTLDAAIAGALIAAVASVLAVLLNVVSSRISRREDREEKHREWLRDKQIRDVEEIIPTLSRFMEEVSAYVDDLKAEQSLQTEELVSSLRSISETSSGEEEEFINTDVAESLETSRQSLKETNAKLLDLAFEREPWFSYSASRLSIWFDLEDETRLNLSQIGNEFKKFYVGVYRAANRLENHFYFVSRTRFRNGQNLTQQDIDKARELSNAFDEAAAKRPKLEAMIVEFQLKLADKFKERSSGRRVEPSEDGLLVSVARWTEKSLRRLLRLR